MSSTQISIAQSVGFALNYPLVSSANVHSDTSVHRRTCHFTGRVQGVGFRYTVHNLAMPHNVAGYVRNLPDGRVELVMEGPDEEMDHLIESIRQKMNHFIRRVDMQVEPPSHAFTGFSIKH